MPSDTVTLRHQAISTSLSGSPLSSVSVFERDVEVEGADESAAYRARWVRLRCIAAPGWLLWSHFLRVTTVTTDVVSFDGVVAAEVPVLEVAGCSS